MGGPWTGTPTPLAPGFGLTGSPEIRGTSVSLRERSNNYYAIAPQSKLRERRRSP
jgi:hypothetical protein